MILEQNISEAGILCQKFINPIILHVVKLGVCLRETITEVQAQDSFHLVKFMEPDVKFVVLYGIIYAQN